MTLTPKSEIGLGGVTDVTPILDDPKLPKPDEPFVDSERALADSTATPVVTGIQTLPTLLFNLPETSYLPTPLFGPEPLMFLNVRVSGQPMRALVDSDASRSSIGSRGLRMLIELDVKPKTRRGLVQVANSRVECVSQEITAPVALKKRVEELCMRVLPSLPFDLALGLDFLKCFGILVDSQYMDVDYYSLSVCLSG